MKSKKINPDEIVPITVNRERIEESVRSGGFNPITIGENELFGGDLELNLNLQRILSDPRMTRVLGEKQYTVERFGATVDESVFFEVKDLGRVIPVVEEYSVQGERRRGRSGFVIYNDYIQNFDKFRAYLQKNGWTTLTYDELWYRIFDALGYYGDSIPDLVAMIHFNKRYLNREPSLATIRPTYEKDP